MLEHLAIVAYQSSWGFVPKDTTMLHTIEAIYEMSFRLAKISSKTATSGNIPLMNSVLPIRDGPCITKLLFPGNSGLGTSPS